MKFFISTIVLLLLFLGPAVSQPCGAGAEILQFSCSTTAMGAIEESDADQITGMYSCGDPFDSLPGEGPEHIYAFSPQSTGEVTIVLSGMNCDLDLYVLDDTCNTDEGCITGSTNTMADESVTFIADVGVVYYVIIESLTGELNWPCNYTLGVESIGSGGCPEDCDNGLDDDMDGDTDCEDLDCGPDTDGDGQCNSIDADDDNDGVPDSEDTDPLNPFICQDLDEDGCDDCSVGNDGFGPDIDYDPFNDGTDTDSDGICDAGDNCVNVANPLQSDFDDDGIGDLCDMDFITLENIGIGTDTPLTRLHIYNGTMFIDNNFGGFLMRSPDGNCWLVNVDNTGSLTAQQTDCPQ